MSFGQVVEKEFPDQNNQNNQNNQNKNEKRRAFTDTDTTSFSGSTAYDKLKDKTIISDYLIISHESDTTFVDTTLSINKLYKFNYLRKDNFELLKFSNLGQTYNKLGYSFYNKN